jgi:hypothetical protein
LAFLPCLVSPDAVKNSIVDLVPDAFGDSAAGSLAFQGAMGGADELRHALLGHFVEGVRFG